MLSSLTALVLLASPLKVALLPLSPGEGVTASVSSAVADALAGELRRFPDVRLLTKSELEAVLSVERQKALMGCQSDQCVTELAGAMDVDQLVNGTLSKLGQSWILHLQRFDAKNARTVSSSDRRKKGGSIDDVLDELPAMARELFVDRTPAPRDSLPVQKVELSPKSEAAKLSSIKDEPLDFDRARLQVVTDGKGFYMAFVPFGGTDAPLLAGQGTSLYAQRVFGGGSEGNTRFSLNFWEPRANYPAQAMFELRDGKYLLTCGEKEHVLTPVAKPALQKLRPELKLFDVRWQRRAWALARDDEGTTFFVDQARAPAENQDFRLYMGSGKNIKGQVPEVLAFDSQGLILGTPEGKLRINREKQTMDWLQGNVKTPLTYLDVESNVKRIYQGLNIYSEPLGTPCDGKF